MGLALLIVIIVGVPLAAAALVSKLLGPRRVEQVVRALADFPHPQLERLIERLVRARPVRMTGSELVGAVGTVEARFEPVPGAALARGVVRVERESWRAEVALTELERMAGGAEVIVERVDGLVLRVRPRA
jgi:membrane protein implicated in regulation of membrane protease activity